MLSTQEDYKICGLVGVAGRITAKEEGAFKDLLKIDALRGEDSTGVASIDASGDVVVEKAVGNPYDFLSLRRVEKLFHKTNRVLIGHNRWATSGIVNKANAHPFEFDTLVGVHNGTLKARHNLKFMKDYTVDSEQLYANIESEGLDETIAKVEGAYALVWWDKEDETLKMLRNSERPLVFTITEDKKCMFWASESWMLSMMLARNGIKHGDLFTVAVDKLHTWDIKPDAMFKDAPDLEPSLREVAQKKTMAVVPMVRPGTVGTGAITTGGSTIKLPPVELRPPINPDKMRTWVRLKMSGLHVDANNNKFLVGIDPIGIEEYRLYSVNEAFLRELANTTLTGKIFGHSPTLKYYLISMESVKDVMDPNGGKQAKKEEEAEESDGGSKILHFPVLDHEGREISEINFYYRYSTCSYCSRDIDYGEKYKPLNRDTCLCSDCVTVKEAINI